MKSSMNYRNCAKWVKMVLCPLLLFMIYTHYTSPPMPTITLFKLTMMRRMKSNGWCIFTKAQKRTLMRKSGLTQVEMLLIYLKLTRTESISLRLWSKTLCCIFLGCHMLFYVVDKFHQLYSLFSSKMGT